MPHDEDMKQMLIGTILMTTLIIPAGCRSEISSNEASAVNSLKQLCAAEAVSRCQDLDGNGEKDYWTYDVSCLYRMFRADGTTKAALIDRDLSEADAAPADVIIFDNYDYYVNGNYKNSPLIAVVDGAPKPKNGYFFRAMTTDVSGQPFNQVTVGANKMKALSKSKYAFVAYPTEYGKTGKRTFIMGIGGTIYSKDTAGQPVLQWLAHVPAYYHQNPDRGCADPDSKLVEECPIVNPNTSGWVAVE